MQRLSRISCSIYQVSQHKYDNFGKIVYLNGLLLVNMSFGMAATTIMPVIASQVGYDSLGQVFLLLQYFSSTIANIISPSYLQKLTYRQAFFIHATQGILQCLCGLFIAIATSLHFYAFIVYGFTIISSLATGLFFGGLWVAQNLYISQNCNDLNKALFFGVSNSLSNSSGVVGSLISYLLIAPLGTINYFVALFIFSAITQLLYLFVLEPPGKVTPESQKPKQSILRQSVSKRREIELKLLNKIHQPQKEQEEFEQFNPSRVSMPMHQIHQKTSFIQRAKDRYNSVKMSFVNTDTIDQLVLARVQQRRETFQANKQQHEVVELFNELPIEEQLKQILGVAMGNKIRPLLPYMVSTGIILGFEYGVYYQLITQAILHTYPGSSDDIVQTLSFKAFGAQGLAEIFGGLIVGYLGDKYLTNYASIVQSSWMHMVVVLTLSNFYINNFTLAILVGFLLGFTDCAGQANCMSLLSEDWGDDVRVFGLYNCLQNIGAMLAIFVSILLSSLPFQHYMMVFGLWMMLSNYCMHYYRRTRKIQEFYD